MINVIMSFYGDKELISIDKNSWISDGVSCIIKCVTIICIIS